MFKEAISVYSLAALAVLAILGSSGQALAQYRSRPAYSYPFISSIDAPQTYGSYTQGPGFFYRASVAPPDAPEEQVAYLHIRVVPPHAEISFEGSKTAQIGSSRLYISPPLNQGENYIYTIQVSWKENGREVAQQRKVSVRAGDRLSIVFRQPPTAAPTSTLQTKPGS
jgi:uncharacterized protein (TIGR03000 family)